MTASQLDGYLYTSNDGGSSWSRNRNISSVQPWLAVAMSGDGRIQGAVTKATNGKIFVSLDYGSSWSITSPRGIFTGIGVSGTGAYITAVTPKEICTSSDAGVNWNVSLPGVVGLWDVAMSFTGSIQVVSGTRYVNRSDDFGLTWRGILLGSTNAMYDKVAMSCDGSHIAVIEVRGSFVQMSVDGGVTWKVAWNIVNAAGTKRGIFGIAMSHDGRFLKTSHPTFYVGGSSDFGISWKAGGSKLNWWSVAMSGDGNTWAFNTDSGALHIYNSSGFYMRGTGVLSDWKGIAIQSGQLCCLCRPLY